jgi:hypothetical protein
MSEEELKTNWNQSTKEKTKYKASVSPVFSKIHLDKEWTTIRKFGEKNSGDQ